MLWGSATTVLRGMFVRITNAIRKRRSASEVAECTCATIHTGPGRQQGQDSHTQEIPDHFFRYTLTIHGVIYRHHAKVHKCTRQEAMYALEQASHGNV